MMPGNKKSRNFKKWKYIN